MAIPKHKGGYSLMLINVYYGAYTDAQHPLNVGLNLKSLCPAIWHRLMAAGVHLRGAEDADRPSKFPFFGRIPNSSSIRKVPLYDRYSNFLEGAYSGK